MTMKNRLINAIIVGIFFVVAGYLIPQTYYSYLDNTNYYQINNVSIDKEFYAPGDDVIVTISRTSLVNANATAVRELVLLQIEGEDQIFDEVYRVIDQSSIDVGTQIIKVHFQLPQNLREGEYFWRGTIAFDVREREKTVSFTTPTFDIVKAETISQK